MKEKKLLNSLNKSIEAIQQGLICTIPILYISSFIVLILSISWPPFTAFLATPFGQGFESVLRLIYRGTYMVLSPVVLISTSYNILSKDLKLDKENINPILPVIIVVGCYYTIIPQDTIAEVTHYAGPTGLFVAMVAGVALSKGLAWFYNHQFFKFSLSVNDKDWGINNTLRFIEPAAYLYGLTGIVVYAYSKITVLKVFANMRGIMVDSFFRETTKFVGVLAYEIGTHLLWFLGIHGTNFAENYTQDTFVAASNINNALYLQGLPPTEIFTKQFFDAFVFIGGAGATLSLIIALFLTKSSMRRFNSVKFSIFFGIFNINEILVYGLPVVFNIYFLIPFIITPVVLTLTTFAAMYFNLVPYTVQDVFWSTPLGFSGYAATHSFRGVIMQGVNLGIGAMIYLPFVKGYAKKKDDENIRTAKALLKDIAAIGYVDVGNGQNLAQRHDDLGYLTRSLAEDMKQALDKNINPMHMVFQPLVKYDDKEKRMIGAEALLRWDHEVYGAINPEVIVAVACHAGLINKLGNWIIRYALKTQRDWVAQGLEDVYISINLSPQQLNGDLDQYLMKTIKEFNLDPGLVEVEITETATVEATERAKALFDAINGHGIKVAIDDFGMGHSSLLYIRNFNIKTVKIDGSLVQDITTNRSSYEIVASICGLCEILGLKSIAEFVETEAHVEMLCALGCDVFQGYYFSKPLSANALLAYAKENNFMSVV